MSKRIHWVTSAISSAVGSPAWIHRSRCCRMRDRYSLITPSIACPRACGSGRRSLASAASAASRVPLALPLLLRVPQRLASALPSPSLGHLPPALSSPSAPPAPPGGGNQASNFFSSSSGSTSYSSLIEGVACNANLARAVPPPPPAAPTVGVEMCEEPIDEEESTEMLEAVSSSLISPSPHSSRASSGPATRRPASRRRSHRRADPGLSARRRHMRKPKSSSSTRGWLGMPTIRFARRMSNVRLAGPPGHCR
mmetsp:Transcript_112966/g.319974  ORF Transcript_112966/g.319974 Transcript_112966/m.319974 type:complete len:253 (-) Transcript_112966:246-1004(-)